MRKKRAIISPNLGFLVQLTNFYKRMYRPQELSNNYIPKMFAVGCHQPEDPNTIVVRLIDKLFKGFTGKQATVLDPRGMFVVGTEEVAYFWIGDECHHSYKDKFYNTTIEYFKKLQEYEKFSTNIIEISQGKEPIEFWNLIGLDSRPSEPYSHNKKWNNW